MKSKYICSHFIGWSFGLMAAASFRNSYHSKWIAGISALFLFLAFLTVDFSSESDPDDKLVP
jgi:hypothetical protein